MEQALIDYGFPDFLIGKILAGKKVNLTYGTVKLKGNVLTTELHRGGTKTEILKTK